MMVGIFGEQTLPAKPPEARERLREQLPQVKHDTPRLTDAFRVELHELLARRLMEEGGYDMGLLKHRLQGVADRVLGPDVVADVIIRAMEQRQAG